MEVHIQGARAALEKSLKYADTMLGLKRVDVPLYCSYEVGTFEDAVEWYGKAIEHGHTHFGAGFGVFFKPESRASSV